MNTNRLSRLAGFLSLSLAFGPALYRARAQEAAVQLDSYVVSATRTPQDPALVPSSVSALSLADLQVEQVVDLRTALAQTPGVDVVNSGAVGGQSTLFMRGADSDEVLFVVDGIRLNTPTAYYSNFLGSADLVGLDRLEVLRGPQSTLYGGSAMGGVILLETAQGSGAPSEVLSAMAGSFGTLGASVTAQGSASGFDYSAAAAHEQTNNDRPYNADKSWNYSTRLEDWVEPWLLVGTTVRGLVGHYEEPGQIDVGANGAGDVQNVTDLATAYVEARSGDDFNSRLTAAWYQDEYNWDRYTPDAYYARNTREITDWQNTWEAAKWVELVGGINLEWSDYETEGPPTAVNTDRSLAEYLSSTFRPLKDVELTAGLRHDDFDTIGNATTGRVGAAWLLNEETTKLHTTYGTGFDAPPPEYRYGSLPYILPNPNLQPETSRGWDAGIDQEFLAKRLTLTTAYFDNRFSNLLQYEVTDPVTYAGQEVNIDSATTRGAEVGFVAKPSAIVTLRGAYTYLDARDDITNQQLIQRPRHTLDLGGEVQPAKPWTAGLGLHMVTERVDGVYQAAPLAGYTTWRAYTSYALRPNVILKARVENLTNRAYEETTGYPALPRAFYGAVEWRL